ncbi:GGDEF domain-containing protein [Tolumonas lignilytica]|uniref:GGDEF domain-containing protein n=1 Tax=Tolumonas lignilytica TaxID=1283284 RepID=UPI0004675C75|nr:sensor domain-containing diguanylate cyclase [Tolumonas lignilytica]
MNIEITEQLQRILVEHIETSGNGIAVLDAEDRFIFFNKAFISLLGIEDHPVLNHSYDELLIWMHTRGVGTATHSSTLDEWLEFVHEQHRSVAFRHYEVDLVDGRWLLVTEQVNVGGEVVLVCNDISHSKKTEHALLDAHKELERLSLTDELTGLSNRRHFMQQLTNEHQRALRYRHPSSLAILDLDHFKKINDQFGHTAGDDVLRHFSSVLRQSLRKQDVIGRLGGEEFALFLPETTQQEAMVLLQRIRHILSSATLEEIAPGFLYTFSAGLTELNHDTPLNCKEWIHVTDQALYRAKRTGRNQVCTG